MSKIQWTEKTWNPVAGCSIVSPGCAHCYAMRMGARLEAMGQAKYSGLTKKANGLPVWTGKINLDDDSLVLPLSWMKPRRVFVNSMSDLFHPDVPFDFVDKVFAVVALTPHHTFQILTKRPERMAEYLNAVGVSGRVSAAPWSMRLPSHLAGRFSIGEPDLELSRLVEKTIAAVDPDGAKAAAIMARRPKTWPLPNVWLGTSCERQKEADERIPHLLRCPAAVRFISAEPLLGPIRFDDPVGIDRPSYFYGYDNFDGPRDIHWVIVGGESGPGARPMDVAWARSIVGQCKAARVSCFVKQLGAKPYGPGIGFRGMKTKELGMGDGFYRFLNDSKGGDIGEFPEDLRVREFPGAVPATAEVRQ